MTNNIHTLASVNPLAELDGVTVEPFCYIEEGVTIGKGTVVGTGTIIKKGSIIGCNNKIGENCVIGGLPQDISFNPSTVTGVLIGDNNTIREMSTVNRATKENTSTTMGNNNFFMAVSHLGHDVVVGSNVIMANNSLLGGFVQVGNGAFISGGCGIHQFCRIGRNVMIAGVTKIVQDVPPFVLVDGHPGTWFGLNSVGLKRAGFTPAERNLMKSFYKRLYNISAPMSANLETILSEEKNNLEHAALLREMVDFVRESKRGIITPVR